MAKRVIDVGAPAYMGQYASLMIIMLAFFILLNAMSQVKEGGFKSGIGEVKNAFGLAGGLGFFNYAFLGRGGGFAPNPNSDQMGEAGIDKSLLMGDGGTGDTDLEVKGHDKAKYLRIKLPFDFQKFSDKISPQMAEELKKIGIGFALFDYKMQIRSYTSDYSDAERNKLLSLTRTAQIMRFLNKVAGVPYSKMECSGYSDGRYFSTDNKERTGESASQGTYFYVFTKGGAKASTESAKQ